MLPDHADAHAHSTKPRAQATCCATVRVASVPSVQFSKIEDQRAFDVLHVAALALAVADDFRRVAGLVLLDGEIRQQPLDLRSDSLLPSMRVEEPMLSLVAARRNADYRSGASVAPPEIWSPA
ncbi:MAG: hypothetical protein JSR26_06120 [Proteobacteria bacterium]|nr:hypothetical protein [Pseudomonadota bacterium]